MKAQLQTVKQTLNTMEDRVHTSAPAARPQSQLQQNAQGASHQRPADLAQPVLENLLDDIAG